MNAHVPTSATTPRARRAHPISACPAAAIGRELERIFREISDRQDAVGDYHARQGEQWNAAVIPELEDRARMLGAQLEWVRAKSLPGIAAQFAELQRALVADRAQEIRATSTERRVGRLSILIQASLADLAGVSTFELGLGVGNADPSTFAETLFSYTGQRVAEGEAVL